MRKFKIVPVFCRGEFKIQPTNKSELAKYIVENITNLEENKTYEIGGSDKLTYKELVDKISKISGINKVFVNVPNFIFSMMSRFVSFDVKGFDEDRVTNTNEVLLKSTLDNDIEMMTNF